MTRRALMIAHDHVSPPGFVGERLEQRGYELVLFTVVPGERFHDPGVSVAFPDAATFDVVVPMGAPWSTYDEQVASWVTPVPGGVGPVSLTGGLGRRPERATGFEPATSSLEG